MKASRPEAMAENRPSPGVGRAGGNGTSGLLGWLRNKFRGRQPDTTLSEALTELIEDEDVTLDVHEKALLTNVTKLRDLEVWDLMVPRAHIIAIDEGAGLADIVQLMGDRYHSRLPVFRETLDQVTGMVHIKDVLPVTSAPDSFNMKNILRPVLFVAPSMGVLELLLEMRDTRIHMAIVVDEFGGTDGLVTIEDLVEEIVGQIEDEHDQEKAQTERIVRRPDGSFDVSGTMQIEEFEAATGPFVTTEERADVDTLGGLVVELLGHVPRRGERLSHGSGVRFEVLDADERRVKRLRVRPVGRAAAEQSP